MGCTPVSYTHLDVYKRQRPIDDFPIELDTFDYINESVEIIDSDLNLEEEIEVNYYRTAEEKVIEKVKENIHEWLNFSISIYLSLIHI